MRLLREWFDRLIGTLRARRADADLRAEQAIDPFAQQPHRMALRRRGAARS